MKDIKILREWTTKSGLTAMTILQNRGHINGYVKANTLEDMEAYAYSINFDDIHLWTPERVERQKKMNDVCVHGGITFTGKFKDIDGYWIGFDTAHAGDDFNLDLVVAEMCKTQQDAADLIEQQGYRTHMESDIFRDETYVRAQCEELATQLAVI